MGELISQTPSLRYVATPMYDWTAGLMQSTGKKGRES